MWVEKKVDQIDHLQSRIHYFKTSVLQNNKTTTDKIFIARHEIIIGPEAIRSNFFCTGEGEKLQSLENIMNAGGLDNVPKIKVFQVKEGGEEDYRFKILNKGLLRFDRRKEE